jgi:HAD superfamily hydrolase (TIGR01450 family)
MKVSGFMIDMDGTVYKGGDPIPGAADFISYLKEKGIPFVFLTNNSSAPRSFYYERVRKMGFDVTEDNVLTSNIAAIRYVLDRYPGKSIYPIASDAVTEEIRTAGIPITDKDPDIVYLTFDRTIDYKKINDGYHFLLGGSRLVATHPDDVCPTEDSYDVDIGPFIRLYESLTGCVAEVVGKPNRLMLDMAASEMGIDPAGAVMVGDRLYTDIRMAEDAGIGSVLVLSGETCRKDLEGSDIRPTYVVDSVADIPSLLEE